MKLKGIIFYAIISLNLFACSKKDVCFCEGERPYQIHTEVDYNACYRLENYMDGFNYIFLAYDFYKAM